MLRTDLLITQQDMEVLLLFFHQYLNWQLNESSNLIFENNSAREKGGAIYVDLDRLELTSQVRYNSYDRLLDTNCLYDTNTVTEQYFYFVNNVAQIAGDDVYGASLAWCSTCVVHIHPKIIQVCLLSLVLPHVFADVIKHINHCAVTVYTVTSLVLTILVR